MAANSSTPLNSSELSVRLPSYLGGESLLYGFKPPTAETVRGQTTRETRHGLDQVQRDDAVNDISLIINACALAFSLLAIIISATFAWRQLRIMEYSNLLPMITDVFAKFGTATFRQHREYIISKLWLEYPSEEFGFTKLPDQIRDHVYAVALFFNTVGILVANGMIDGLAASSYMGGSVIKTWERLEPHIRHERKIRPDENYMAHYEHLACLVRENPPSANK